MRTLAVFKGEDSISGVVELNIKEGENLEHFGVRVMLIGHLCTPTYIPQKSTKITPCQPSSTPCPNNSCQQAP